MTMAARLIFRETNAMNQIEMSIRLLLNEDIIISIFYISILTISSVLYLSKKEYNSWHRKIGHISVKQISKLFSKKLVHGLLILRFEKFELCTTCTLGKQVRSSFKPIKHISTNPTSRSQSLGGKKYYLV